MLRETLTEAVRLRMRSDVPLGAFLSGGIDSTIIAGLMQSLSEQPIHTFSIGFPEKEFDETSYAREAAAKLGTNHHEYIVRTVGHRSAAEDYLALRRTVQRQFGHPDDVSVGSDAAGGDRRPLRRRRRRTVRRL